MLRRFVVLGVVPFTSITYLNYKIYCVVRWTISYGNHEGGRDRGPLSQYFVNIHYFILHFAAIYFPFIFLLCSKRRRSGRRGHEDNLSTVLMTIVGSFLVCNTLRSGSYVTPDTRYNDDDDTGSSSTCTRSLSSGRSTSAGWMRYLLSFSFFFLNIL